MLKFKRVKPKFPEKGNTFVAKPSVVRARVIQGYSLLSLWSDFTHEITTSMYCNVVLYIESINVVVFSLLQITTSGLYTDMTLTLRVSFVSQLIDLLSVE